MTVKQYPLVRHLIGIISLISVLFLFAGCPKMLGTDVLSEPEGANIYINGEYIGISPVYYEFYDGLGDQNLNIIAKMEGFKPTHRLLEDHWGTSWLPTQILIRLEHMDTTTPGKYETSNLERDARNCPVNSYHYDASSGKGTISVNISGKGIEVRRWIVKNIGQICSDKNMTLIAGKETGQGGHYRVLSESVKDNILTIEFEAAY